MNDTLIVSGHPRLSHSTANRIILEELVQVPDTTISDIKTNYPNGEIDIQLEQRSLECANLIILQFPFVWYGMPSHMKAWIEKVFSSGFAFGEGGDKLKGKKLLLSITLGGSSEAYSAEGQHRHPLETFLLPLQLFARYCGLEYLPPVYSYEMASTVGLNDMIVSERARVHAEKVKRVICCQKIIQPSASCISLRQVLLAVG